MIEDKRLIDDMKIAEKCVNSIIYVMERDGFVAPGYVIEKLEMAKHCIEFGLNLAGGEEEE